MTHYLTITPRDPLIGRDGRPFGAGQGSRMRSLPWLYPSVVAGSLRTLLGKQIDTGFSEGTIDLLKALSVAGPFPLIENSLFFPRPFDCLLWEERGRCFGVRPVPLAEGEGCDLPEGMNPVLLPDTVADDFKPGTLPAFWARGSMVAWLCDPMGDSFAIPKDRGNLDQGFLDAPPQDVRFHIKMDYDAGAGAKEDAFFLTAGLDLSRRSKATPIQLALRTTGRASSFEHLVSLDALHPLGGERRLARWTSAGDTSRLWDCPREIGAALDGAKRVRMVLASPAIFSDGWKPGWLNRESEGNPPGSGVTLRLTGAAIERWQPLSGWSLEKPVGPKAIRRLVPAGSVYFFDIVDGNARDLADLWLNSVCDEERNRRDGFGLALWGIWSGHSPQGKGA